MVTSRQSSVISLQIIGFGRSSLVDRLWPNSPSSFRVLLTGYFRGWAAENSSCLRAGSC